VLGKFAADVVVDSAEKIMADMESSDDSESSKEHSTTSTDA